MASYDEQIQFLESTGTQFIDTGICLHTTSDADYSIQMKANVLSDNEPYAVVVNSMYEASPYPGEVIRVQPTEPPTVQVSATPATGSTWTAQGLNTIFEATYVRNETVTVHDVNTTIFAGYDSTKTTPWRFCKMRLYYMRIINHGVIVRDFIPVRVGQTGYLYDKVSDTLFGNDGTGSFVLGPDITDISQITLNGTTYNIKDSKARQSSGGGTAASTTYDNSGSGLQATNVQDAIDELNTKIYDAGNYETVSLTIGSADSTFSPVGQTITVTLEDGSSTDYVLTNSLVISFSVQKGVKYTISGTSTTDYRILPVSYKAALQTRLITMRYIPIATGVFILQSDGNYYLRQEYDAETMAEDAIGVLVLTSALINAGHGIVIGKSDTHTSLKEYDGDLTSSTTSFDGLNNTFKLKSLNGAGTSYCYSKTLTIGETICQGYMFSYAEAQECYSNKQEIGLCLSLISGVVMRDDLRTSTSIFAAYANQYKTMNNNNARADSGAYTRPVYYYQLS